MIPKVGTGFRKRSCASNRLERDDDSKKSHSAPLHDHADARAAITGAEAETEPKMPPCALIILRPMSWNSGKYDAQQSDSTMQRKPRSLASRTVVLTQTSVVTPHTSSVSMPRFLSISSRSV